MRNSQSPLIGETFKLTKVAQCEEAVDQNCMVDGWVALKS